MIEKILLLDANPLKVENYNNWFKEVRDKRRFVEISADLLEAGMTEVLKTINLFERENAYTLRDAKTELETFYKLITTKEIVLTQNLRHFPTQGRRANVKNKQNKKLLKKITTNMELLLNIIEDRIYEPRKHKGYIFYNELINHSTLNKFIKPDEEYSTTDKTLVLTALVRAHHDLDTDIITSDKHIKEIYGNSIQNLVKLNGASMDNPLYLNDKINIINTYNGKTRFERIYLTL